MDQKSYRNSKISSYEFPYEGKLMYQHHKYFDITKFIMNFVKQSIPGNHDKKSYKAYIDEHLNELPSEYKKSFIDKYDVFIDWYDYVKTASERITHRKPRFWDQIPIISSEKQRILNTINLLSHKYLSSKETTIERYGGTFNMKLSGKSKDMGNTLGYHDGTFKVIISPEDATEDTLKHEHFHYLKGRGLFTEQDKKYEMLKDEIIAQISSNDNSLDAISASLLVHYIPEYYSTNNEYCIIDIKDNTPIEEWVFFKNKGGKYIENNTKKNEVITMIKDMWGYMYRVERIKEVAIPKYYTEYEQVVYLLAITPLLRWKNLIQYYTRISGFQTYKEKVMHNIQNELASNLKQKKNT